MKQYIDTNRARWNELVSIHSQSDFYRVKDFLNGQSTLKSVERQELPNVQGKRLFHLQCHFGLDSLSWARQGAKVTGVDLSDKAIELAKELNAEAGLDAQFVCSDIFSLPTVLDGEFDIVFTSYGVLCWLGNLNEWAKVIYRYLTPGGTFYIVEEHPLTNVFDVGKDGDLQQRYNYFSNGEPVYWESERSYTGDNQEVKNTGSYQWEHTLADIFNALLSSGLKVEQFHEFPYCMYNKYPGLLEKQGEYWWLKQNHQIPLLFSLKAVKPQSR
jgi:SAM-dependent methyltransferase